MSDLTNNLYIDYIKGMSKEDICEKYDLEEFQISIAISNFSQSVESRSTFMANLYVYLSTILPFMASSYIYNTFFDYLKAKNIFHRDSIISLIISDEDITGLVKEDRKYLRDYVKFIIG